MLKNLMNGTSHVVLMSPDNGDQGGGSGGGGDGGQQQQGGQQGGQQQQAANQGANSQGGLAWLQGASTEEIAFAQSKGWDKETTAPADQIFRSYHNLQKLFGADKAGNTVVLPGEGADETTVNQFYNRLGRPENMDGYTPKEFAGLDDAQFKSLRETAHKAGITDKQFEALTKWNEQLGTQIQSDLENNVKMQQAEEEANLKKEWGAAYDKNLQLAKEATAKLGLTQDQVNAMQIGLGFDGVLKLMTQLGAGIGEGKFVSSDNGRGAGADNTMTPEQAKTELTRLSSDKDFQEAWMNKAHPRHAEMVRKKSQLSAWAAGQKA